MRSNSNIFPSDSLRDSSIFPRRSRFSKMLSAGGQVPTQMEAPASAIALAMAKPNPPSSATPATSARLPERSMGSMRAHIARAAAGCKSRDRVVCAAHASLGVGDGWLGAHLAVRGGDRLIRVVVLLVVLSLVVKPAAAMLRRGRGRGLLRALLSDRRRRPRHLLPAG